MATNKIETKSKKMDVIDKPRFSVIVTDKRLFNDALKPFVVGEFSIVSASPDTLRKNSGGNWVIEGWQ